MRANRLKVNLLNKVGKMLDNYGPLDLVALPALQLWIKLCKMFGKRILLEVCAYGKVTDADQARSHLTVLSFLMPLRHGPSLLDP